jgi:hypothetical protein
MEAIILTLVRSLLSSMFTRPELVARVVNASKVDLPRPERPSRFNPNPKVYTGLTTEQVNAAVDQALADGTISTYEDDLCPEEVVLCVGPKADDLLKANGYEEGYLDNEAPIHYWY